MEFKEYTDTKIFYNDDNLKPDWTEHEAKFTEFHIKRNKENVLLVIGESWTYGESLPRIQTGLKRFNFDSQIINSYGPAMSIVMDCDYYQYAVPGNCNAFMFKELGRILKHLVISGYKKIYISMQMTEPSREMNILDRLKTHPIYNLYKDQGIIGFKQWLAKYDEIFFDIYNKEIKKYKDKATIIPILWKNFCLVNTPKRDYDFTILTETWLKHSAEQDGVNLWMPGFYTVGWLSDLQKHYGHRIDFDSKYVSDHLVAIEKSNKFLKDSASHFPHPSDKKHLDWAYHLLNTTGWMHV